MAKYRVNTSILQWSHERWEVEVSDSIDTSTWDGADWIDAIERGCSGDEQITARFMYEDPGDPAGDREFDTVARKED